MAQLDSERSKEDCATCSEFWSACRIFPCKSDVSAGNGRQQITGDFAPNSRDISGERNSLVTLSAQERCASTDGPCFLAGRRHCMSARPRLSGQALDARRGNTSKRWSAHLPRNADSSWGAQSLIVRPVFYFGFICTRWSADDMLILMGSTMTLFRYQG